MPDEILLHLGHTHKSDKSQYSLKGLQVLKCVCTFFLQNNVLPSGEKFVEGNSVIIQEVSRHHSGIYVCTADNEVGNPARAEIDLKVLCKFLYFFKICPK